MCSFTLYNIIRNDVEYKLELYYSHPNLETPTGLEQNL